MEDVKIELWGGIECTINRVGDTYFDQLQFSGHYSRTGDIDEIATLGIKSLRYPLLWEKHQPEIDSNINWSFAEKKLEQIRKHNIKPIAGLVHHGSGPSYVNFFDGSFETGLANYAGCVAKQFPWIEYYTPVNEPLTTARFCGLYGHWYPHKKDDFSFTRVLISECKATVLAMKRIREINPLAKLVQTDDLGMTHSTPALQYQADFENIRRWLTFDLLCSKVIPGHAMWDYLLWSGIDESDLYFFQVHKCPPDIIGLNYYITSQRFIDERIEHYPRHTHGRNHKHDYADVEAVRVDFDGMCGAKELFRQAWERFKLPIAITEVHLHCNRDDQMRWFAEVWEAAEFLKKEGADIKAVTAWALLGSFGWNKILTQGKGDYEPGVFDISSGKPQPLALAKMLRNISVGKPHQHPILQRDGWWKRDIRIIYHKKHNMQKDNKSERECNPLIILGKTGTLGNAFQKVCEQRNIRFILLDRQQVDISRPDVIEKTIKELKPWAIINATGYVHVDDAESNEEACMKANGNGPVFLAEACKKFGVQLLNFSSDLVFDGKKTTPYTEFDEVNPINIYGKSKAFAEKKVMAIFPNSLMVRTSAFFGPWDEYNFVTNTIRCLKSNIPVELANDLYVSPTYVPHLVNACLDLLIDKQEGIWHIANEGKITWSQFAKYIAVKMHLPEELVVAKPSSELNFKAKRPVNSVLRSEKGLILPSLKKAFEQYLNEVAPQVIETSQLMEAI